uniref:VP11 n=1 Tax=Tarumizu tick virus TaxID=2014339 RepID=A0A292G340_9REOV|nr:VP11 [Tarumizu tick virus]BBA54759.1 VP11 [Tarumizu tick virus]BBK20282.1 VP11 [Tarumizu tick virus]BDB06926.1 VP11 [Tarumizu tick virus]
MAVAAILGSGLSNGTVVLSYERIVLNGQVRPARILAKPLISYILGMNSQVLNEWGMFQSWCESNYPDKESNDDWLRFSTFSDKLCGIERTNLVLRHNNGNIEVGAFSNEKRGDRGVFEPCGSPVMAGPLSEYLIDCFSDWLRTGPKDVIDWMARESRDFSLLNIEVMTPMRVVQSSSEKWRGLLAHWTDVAETRAKQSGDESGPLRSFMVAGLICCGQGINLSPQVALVIEAQGGSAAMLITLLSRMNSECAPEVAGALKDGALQPKWKRYFVKSGGPNYVVPFNSRVPGGRNCTFEDLAMC